MPTIRNYTRQVQPSQTVQAGASGQAFGANQSGTQYDAQALQQAGGVIAQQSQKRMNRKDVIQKSLASSKYHEELLQEYQRTKTEANLLEDSTVESFNQFVRNKTDEYVSNFGGSEDARASLQAQLVNTQAKFITQVGQDSFDAQQTFLKNQIGDQLNSITQMAKSNPANIDQYFKEFDAIVSDKAPALFPEDEISFLEAGRESILSGVLDSYVDAGQYEEAKELINDQPFFVQSIRPEKLNAIMQQVNGGLNARNKKIQDTRDKVSVIKSVAQELGIEMNPSTVFEAATGISAKVSPSQKVEQFAKLTNQDVATLKPSVVAKLAFGIDLPGGEVDFNKERLPNGGFTPKGIGAMIKEPISAASNARVMLEKVTMQAQEFFNSGNEQAGLAAMISFQKLIDDGAAVREGDIKLSAEGVSALDRLALSMKKIGEGGIATAGQMNEMVAAAEVFSNSILEASKTYIDPYLADARKEGYRMLDIGVPQESYDTIFSGVKTGADRSADMSSKIEGIAKQNNMTVDEIVKATAASSGKTEEQVRKDFNL